MKLSELKSKIKEGDIVKIEETMKYTVTGLYDNDTFQGVAIGGGQKKVEYETLSLSEVSAYFPLTPIES